MAVVEVLERIGWQADFPERQTCCGQPAFNTGYRDEARTVARHFLEVFRDAEYIIVPSGSCASMIAHQYEDLFQAEPEWLELARGSGRGSGSSRSSCWRWPGSRTSARAWSEWSPFTTVATACANWASRRGRDGCFPASAGSSLREMDAAEECCGFGGTFSVKFPGISGGMARTKIDSIQRSGGGAVVGLDASCLLQIQGALSRAGLAVGTMHLAEVLAHR